MPPLRRDITISTTANTTTFTDVALEVLDQHKQRHDLIVRLAEPLVQEIQSVGDRLYDLQYGSDEHCHTTENRELRPLFNKLNDAYHDWQRARVAPLTGDYAIDPLRVLESYQTVMRRFARAMRVIGFSEDHEDLYEALLNLNTLVLGKLLVLDIILEAGD